MVGRFNSILFFVSVLIFSHMAISKENLENKLTECETSIIKESDLVTKALIENWVQPHKYKNEFLYASFRLVLNNDGGISKFYLKDTFCGIDEYNECEEFIVNAKETIKNTFPVAKYKIGVNGEETDCVFRSDYGNAIFENRIKKQNKK
jgi:hypothetical protein